MSQPPVVQTPIFNPSFFSSNSDAMTIEKADQRYLSLGGGVLGGSLSINGALMVGGQEVVAPPSYVVGITPGTAANSKALVLGASGEIATISSLTATNIYGTLQTATQTNITSLGTLSGLTIGGNLLFTGASRTITGLSSISATTLTGALSTAAQPSITSVGTLSSLTVAGSISGTLATASQPSITSVGTLSSLTVAGSISGTLATASQPNITSIGTLSSLTVAGSISGTLATASQPNITSIGTLSSLTVAGSISGTLATASQPNITSVGTLSSLTVAGSISGTLATASQPNITSIGTLSSLTVSGSIVADTITKSGTQTMSATTLNLNPTTLQIRGATLSATATELNALSGCTSTATELNYNDIANLGIFQASRSLTLNSLGIGSMPLGTSDSNCFRFYGGTLNRENLNLYRVSDDSGLVIATRTTSSSNSKSYPVLNLISTDNTSSYSAGVSASAADLMRIDWMNKPGFASQYHRMCFDIGYTRLYKSGYPHTFGLVSSADAICIAPNASTATPSSNGCLYLVSDTISKMIFNTDNPYNGTYGEAPITLNGGNMYIKCSNALNDGSSSIDMPLYVESSNATSPIKFAFQISNSVNTTSTNSAYVGTVSNNDLHLMTNNSKKLTITAGGRVGINTSTPRAGLEVSGTATYTIIPIATNTYIYNVSTNAWANLGGGPVSITICVLFNDDIYVNNSVYTSSDRRLKENIKNLDVDIERYKLLTPCSYNYKNQADRTKVGLIAQDVSQVCGEALVYTENENMKVEEEGDLEGIQLGMDYNQITVLNVDVIKKLLAMVEDQQAQINELRAIISQ